MKKLLAMTIAVLALLTLATTPIYAVPAQVEAEGLEKALGGEWVQPTFVDGGFVVSFDDVIESRCREVVVGEYTLVFDENGDLLMASYPVTLAGENGHNPTLPVNDSVPAFNNIEEVEEGKSSIFQVILEWLVSFFAKVATPAR